MVVIIQSNQHEGTGDKLVPPHQAAVSGVGAAADRRIDCKAKIILEFWKPFCCHNDVSHPKGGSIARIAFFTNN